MKAVMTAARGATVVLFCLSFFGCHRGDSRCAPATPPTLELRDGGGAVRLALKNGAVCDGHGRAVGTLDVSAGAVTLKDEAGNPRLVISPTQVENTAAARDGKGGVRLRLYRDAVQSRVLRPDGVPVGSMTRNGDAARVYDQSSAPVMTVEPRDRDLVLRDTNGAIRGSITPARDGRAAGVFGLSGLDPAEQLAIYVFWSR